MSEEKKTGTYPYRPPKKYPRKDLHGRVRFGRIFYHDLPRAQKFFVNVFGWDMIDAVILGIDDYEHRPLFVATGPSQVGYEGLVPGLMNTRLYYDDTGDNKPFFMMEVHMDEPITRTLEKVEAYGGKVIGFNKSAADGNEDANWFSGAYIQDPAGHKIYLWKCPASRTWEEPEAGYDKE